MGCTNVPNDRDDELLKQAREGKFSQPDPEMLKEVMPKVRETIKQRVIELKEEGVEKARGELIQRIEQEGREPTDIEKLDLEVKPTEAEYQEMYKIGTGLGMKEFEIFNTPAVTGIKDTESMTHINTKVIRGAMKETLKILKTSRIPDEFKNQATVNMIVFVDKQEPPQTKGDKKHISVEKVVEPEELQKTDLKTLERSRNLYIFQNKKGRLLPKTEEERKDFHWKMAHGICHINDAREGRFDTRIIEHRSEWIKACEVQLKVGVVDKEPDREEVPYSLSEFIPEKHNDPEVVQYGREFRAQHFAAWVTDSPKLCPEMREFFDRHFKE